jgi:hypothetical protein
MSSGWGCQYLTKNGDEKEWCRLLSHKCDPGCRGCVLFRAGLFSQESRPTKERVAKNRSDDPLGGR